jgi:DNA-binding transcriptional MerR regulator
MSEPDFEPRPLYGIGTVARLTGLKPDTLRVWERRYGLGASHKSASGRRQYTQADLEHLQLVAGLVEGGARIGEIAKAERKTLEMLTRQQGRSAAGSVRQKPRAALVGPACVVGSTNTRAACRTSTHACREPPSPT